MGICILFLNSLDSFFELSRTNTTVAFKAILHMNFRPTDAVRVEAAILHTAVHQ